MIESKVNEYKVVLNMTDLLLSMNEKALSYSMNSNCSRIYIGSYSCSRYFSESVKYYRETFKHLAKQNNLKITLVVPIVAQSDWNFVVNTLRSMIESEDYIDEYVVNDYGMLRMLKEIKEDFQKDFEIIAGRLFHKNFRDGRYLDYTQTQASIYHSSMLTGIKAMEVDLTNSHIDCSELSSDMELHMHYPYTLATSGYVCEFFSSNLPTAVRFRSDTDCQLECCNHYMQIEGDGCTFKQVGRAVYFENPKLYSCNREIQRYLYWPLEEVFS